MKKMKKIIGWPVAHLLYLLGDLVSRLMNRWDGVFGVLYPVYNRLMVWSCDVNDWAGLKLWTKAGE